MSDLTPTPLPDLRARDVLLVFVSSFGLAALLVAGTIALSLVFDRTDLALPLGLTAGSAGMCLGLWAALSWRRGWGWQEMGFVRLRRSGWHLCWQVPVSITASLAGAALLGTSLGLAPDAESGQADLDVALDTSPWLLAVLVLCIVLVAPAAEEVLFRRVLLDWLMSRTVAVVAVPVAAVAFAVVHVVPVAMVYIVFMGLFTCLLRLWHGSLWAPLALHSTNNALVVLIAVPALTT